MAGTWNLWASRGQRTESGWLNPALQNALDKFTLDVTAKARDGLIDPVFGRDTEIRQMVDILSRRRKKQPDPRR